MSEMKLLSIFACCHVLQALLNFQLYYIPPFFSPRRLEFGERK
ncbi:hypothetical protein BVRB_5g120710 [Beta vulgaris subsp. vulgaris]|nr:hypothetical protein BVRB_5g120710 [Beta vulgaris subsp. vulgaris]